MSIYDYISTDFDSFQQGVTSGRNLYLSSKIGARMTLASYMFTNFCQIKDAQMRKHYAEMIEDGLL